MIGPYQVVASTTRPWSHLLHVRSLAGGEFFLKIGRSETASEAPLLKSLRDFLNVPRVVAEYPSDRAVLLAKYQASCCPDLEVRPQILALAATWEQVSLDSPELLSGLPEACAIADFDAFQRLLPGYQAYWKQTLTSGQIAAGNWAIEFLESRKADVLTLLRTAQGWARVLVHGDLHIGNSAWSLEEGLIIGDWADALAGPPGSAFALLFSAEEVCLGNLGKVSQVDSRVFDLALRAYVDAFVPPLKAPPWSVILGGILFGLFRALLNLESLSDRSLEFLNFRSKIALQTALDAATLIARLS